MTVSIILPVVREEKAKRVLKLLEENAGYPYRVLMAVDTDRIGAPKMVKKLVGQSQDDLVCFIGDDTLPEKDFLKNAVEAMQSFPDGWGLVGLNDKTGRTLATHWLAHKKLLDHLDGEFFHTGYIHCFCDNELQERASLIGRYTYAKDAIVLHDHPLLSGSHKEDADKDYKRVYSKEVFKKDEALFKKRRKLWMRENEFKGKVGLCLPITLTDVHREFFLSFTNMDKPTYTTVYAPTNVLYDFPESIAVTRNDLASRALDEGCDKIIMMDTDQVYPEDTVTKLVSHDLPMVGAVIHRRYPPFAPLLYRGSLGNYKYVTEKEMYSGELVSVDATGCGCVCYDAEIFSKVEYPWYKLKKDENGKTIGEDIGLCSRIREKKIPIYVDTSIQVGHLGTMLIDKDYFKFWSVMNAVKGADAAKENERCHTDQVKIAR